MWIQDLVDFSGCYCLTPVTLFIIARAVRWQGSNNTCQKIKKVDTLIMMKSALLLDWNWLTIQDCLVMIYMEIKCLASLNNNNNIYNWTNSHLCCALFLVLCPSHGLRIISSLLFAIGKSRSLKYHRLYRYSLKRGVMTFHYFIELWNHWEKR